MSSSKKTINWEKYAALSSMFVAVFALAISIWQGYTMKEHNKLSLRPYLETELNNDEAGSWELFINNHGMGPAQASQVHFYVDGIARANREEFLLSLGEEPDCYGRGNINRFYKVNDRQMVFKTIKSECYKKVEELEAMLLRARIIVEYQSLYSDSFELVIGGG